MTIQNHSNKLKYLIDPTFTVVSRLLFFFIHLKVLKKVMLKEIIDILFHLIMYQISK